MKVSKRNKKIIASKSLPEIKKPKFQIVKRVALFVLAIGILTFNTVVKVDLKAENNSESITIENLLKAHNEYRKTVGAPELKLNNLLNISSSKKGDIMIANQCWSHYCPPGKSPWDFFDDASYDYIYAGENLAEGYYTMDSLMQAWINSKTHRDNIIKPEFTEVGFSILYGDYLNNSNNVLVVAHFGTTAAGASVFSAQNPLIEITKPEDNFQTTNESLDVSGTVSGLDKVRVFSNNNLKGDADISGGIFTYRISKLDKGENTIWADGSNTDTSLDSNKIKVIYTPAESTDNSFVTVSSTDNNISMTPENKNLINLIFIGFLALIFLADIILVSRTIAINSTKSFSHYHLALFILVGLIIIIGGFAGQIQNGISV